MVNKLSIYKLLCTVRVALVLIPQVGYIHPDEHFQGPEVVYGDIAEYNVLRTWEFSTSEPIRSILFPYSVTVVPAIIIRLLAWLNYKVDNYLILILPRLLMCILSFFQDLCIYAICVNMGTNYVPCLILFASSYVTLVYFTRTFSNSLESLLFAFLLFLLFKALKLHKQMTNQKTPDVLSQLTFCSFMYGVTLSLGCFIRPTFICFAVLPMIFWCIMFLRVYRSGKIIFISFLLGVFSMSICIIAIDSLYYNKVNFVNSKLRIICTPINFLLYNLNSENLISHGLHSRWLHILVNIPLLFSVYGVVLIFYFIKKCYYILYRLQMNFEMLLLLFFSAPLILLSLIPHQEPRFIIPLIIPLCLVYNDQHLKIYLSKKLFIGVWVICNMFCLLFYGFIHQAGVYLSINYLNNVIASDSSVIYFQTYMPPRYLFSLTDKVKNASVHDFSYINFNKFVDNTYNVVVEEKPSRVFIVLPFKMLRPDSSALNMPNFSSYNYPDFEKYKFVDSVHIFPHLSTENLPKFANVWAILQTNSTFLSKLHELKEMFSIHILICKQKSASANYQFSPEELAEISKGVSQRLKEVQDLSKFQDDL